MTYDVFVSYRRGFPAEARLVKEKLKERGFRVFLDVDDLGQCYFDERLEAIIRETGNFVCVLTPGSLERCHEPSDWVRRELETAFDAGLNIVVVTSDPKFDWGLFELPPSLQRLPAINAVPFDHKYFEAFVTELVGRLHKSAVMAAQEEFAGLDRLALSADFRAWQNDALAGIYRDALPGTGADGGTQSFPSIAGEQYALLLMRAADADSPFLHRRLGSPTLVEREIRELPDLAAPGPLPDWVVAGPAGPDRQRYFQLLALTRRVRRWNMRGFALSRLRLNERHEVAAVEAELCTYGENCLTSHLLGYRMLRAFADGKPPESVAQTRPKLIWEPSNEDPGSLVMRLQSAEPFLPLISVQALVIYRNPFEDDEWQLVAMVREGNVAAAAGFWQFPPAGGFEIYGRENEEHEHVLSQFDLRLAIVREFLEEIYGDADMACENAADASGDHTGSLGFQQVMHSLRNRLLSIHLLGVVTDLVGLRSEFSFLMVIEDPKLLEMTYTVNLEGGTSRQARWLRGSHEGKRLMRVPIADIGKFIKGKTWNPSSMGMLKLLADAAAVPGGWFRSKYPDFPAMSL